MTDDNVFAPFFANAYIEARKGRHRKEDPVVIRKVASEGNLLAHLVDDTAHGIDLAATKRLTKEAMAAVAEHRLGDAIASATNPASWIGWPEQGRCDVADV